MRLQKGAYDVCIVIPAYAEGLDIVPALRSIAYQVRRIVVGIRVAVIVVVNNRPKPPKDVFDSNVDTYNFLRSISSSKSKRLSLTQNYVHKVGIQVAAINRFSSRNAIRDCNVGRARREGFSEAVRACKDEGIIIGTDADTRLAHTYIKQALTLRDGGNFVATGPVTVLDGHQSSEVEKIIFIARAYEHLLQFDSYQSWQSGSRNHIPHLSGSNMVFSRSAYLDTDGIDNLPGAEDVRLGMKMSAKGHTIIHNDNLQVFTDPRPSFRAPLGHSFGQAQHQYREGAKNPAYPFLPSRAFVRATKWIIPTFESLRNRDVCDKKTFYSVLQREFRTMGIQIKQERMKIWWNKFELCRKFPGSMFDPFISVDVMDLIRESKPNVSPIDAFRELSAGFSELQDKAFLEDLVRYTGLGGLHYCFFLFHMSDLCARFYENQKSYQDKRTDLSGTEGFKALETYIQVVPVAISAFLSQEKIWQMMRLLDTLGKGDLFDSYFRQFQLVDRSHQASFRQHEVAEYYLKEILPNKDRKIILASPDLAISDTFCLLHRTERKIHDLIGEYIQHNGA